MKRAWPIKDPKFLLMYSALQFAPDEMAKPDGSLSLAYLAGALRAAGYHVQILDVSVGNDKDDLKDTFFDTTFLPSGLVRCGMKPDRIAEEIREYDIVGISSIFTTQTRMVLDLARFVKEVDPTKLVIAGVSTRGTCATGSTPAASTSLRFPRVKTRLSRLPRLSAASGTWAASRGLPTSTRTAARS